MNSYYLINSNNTWIRGGFLFLVVEEKLVYSNFKNKYLLTCKKKGEYSRSLKFKT